MSAPRLPTGEPPDLWPEIERRLADVRPIAHRRRGRARTAAVALAIFAASAAFVWQAFTLGERKLPPPAGPLDDIREGWTRLPDPPEARTGAAYVWTGSELLAWSGCDPSVHNDCVPTRDGFAFDPVTERWSTMPAAPVAIPYAHAVWTGDEAIFLSLGSEPVGGVAYEPSTLTWRRIADAPIAARSGVVVVWTGSRIFAWGGGERSDPAMDGALYDPGSDTWTNIAPAPVGLNQASGVWTGSEVMVFGALLDNRNHAETDNSVGARYNPETDTWRMLPSSQLSPQAVSAAWTGDRLLAWDYDLRSQEYVPGADAWVPSGRVPLEPGECYPDSVALEEGVFAFYCGEAALFDPQTATWQEIHGGMLDKEVWSDAYKRSLKLWRFADLVPAGDVVFLAPEGITLSDKGVACYGCSGSPTSFWAYRPPALRP